MPGLGYALRADPVLNSARSPLRGLDVERFKKWRHSMADFRLWSDDFPINGFMPKAQECDDKMFGVDGEGVGAGGRVAAFCQVCPASVLTRTAPSSPTA